MKPPIYILALNLDDAGIENQMLSAAAISDHTEALGMYNDHEEVSWIIPANHNNTRDKVAYLAEHYQQEAYLYVDEHSNATLLRTNGQEEQLGKFMPASEGVAQCKSSCTFDIAGEEFYITVG